METWDRNEGNTTILLWPFIYSWTVSLISSDLPFVDRYVRFTTIPFKPLLDQGFRWYYKAENYVSRDRASVHYSTVSTVYTVTSSLPALNLQLYEQGYPPHHCPDKGLKGTVVNRTCLYKWKVPWNYAYSTLEYGLIRAGMETLHIGIGLIKWNHQFPLF